MDNDADSDGSSPESAAALWEFGDIGFDTKQKLWFIQFTNSANQALNSRYAKSIKISNGLTNQYQWKDNSETRPFWHIRARFFSRDVESISETPDGSIHIKFLAADRDRREPPEGYAYVSFAYHLRNNSSNKFRAPMGFLEFIDARGQVLSRIDNRWIIVEGASCQTSGEYPNIRMRIKRADVGEIILTSTCAIIRGVAELQQPPGR